MSKQEEPTREHEVVWRGDKLCEIIGDLAYYLAHTVSRYRYLATVLLYLRTCLLSTTHSKTACRLVSSLAQLMALA